MVEKKQELTLNCIIMEAVGPPSALCEATAKHSLESGIMLDCPFERES